MALGYRAIFRLDQSVDAVELAEQHLGEWLGGKLGLAPGVAYEWGGPGQHPIGEKFRLRVVHEDYDASRGRRRLYRFTESNRFGDFEVALLAAALPGLAEHGQTVVLEVDKLNASRTDAFRHIDPPRLAGSLLQATVITDGAARIHGAPVAVGRGQIPALVADIRDPRRTISIVVAPLFAPDLEDRWLRVVTSLTRQSVGVASVYVIAAEAQADLDAALGPAHTVAGGRIRTFLPKVDLSDPPDGLRHKWLGPTSFARAIHQSRVDVELQRRHAERARLRFIEDELPSDIRRTVGVLRRAELLVAREAGVSARLAATVPTDGTVPGTAESTRELPGGRTEHGWRDWAVQSLSRWLQLASPHPEDAPKLDSFIATKLADAEILAEQLDQSEGRADALEEHATDLRRRIEDLELDLAQAEVDEVESQRELAELRRRLAKTARPDTYVAPDPVEWEAPSSVEELVARLTPGEDAHAAINYVQFTGAIEGALEIDRRYPSGLYARTLWLYSRVLHDYSRLKAEGAFQGSVYMYLRDDRTEGSKCAPARLAATESDSVLNNPYWRAERVFPVPADVEPHGEVLMDAHFKPSHHDTFAPRMHFFDDTANTGKVYIGYVGRHLTNTQT